MGCKDGMFACFKDCCIRDQQFCYDKAGKCRFCQDWQIMCGSNQMPPACSLYCYKQNVTYAPVPDTSGVVDEVYFWATWSLVSVIVLATAITLYCFWANIIKFTNRRDQCGKKDYNDRPGNQDEDCQPVQVPFESFPFLAEESTSPADPSQPSTQHPTPPFSHAPSGSNGVSDSQDVTTSAVTAGREPASQDNLSTGCRCSGGGCRDRRLDGIAPTEEGDAAICLRDGTAD